MPGGQQAGGVPLPGSMPAFAAPMPINAGTNFGASASGTGEVSSSATYIANGAQAPAGMPGNGGSEPKPSWISLLESEAAQMLSAGRPEVMDALGRQFESALIKTALRHTHGRKNDAAVRLGIGRNTITRKIHELGIDGAKDE